MRHHAVGRFSRMRRQHLTAADLRPRRERQPGREVFGSLPSTQISAAFTNQAQRQVRPESMNLCKAYASKLRQDRTNVEVHSVTRRSAMAGCGHWGTWRRLLRRQHGQHLFDLGGAIINPSRIDIVEFKRRSEREDRLGLGVAHQSGTDRLDPGLAAHIAHWRKNAWLSLSIDDCSDDLQTGDASDVRDNVGPLQIQEGQRLLHVLDVVSSVVEKPFAPPQVDAQRCDVPPGPETGTQQSAGRRWRHWALLTSVLRPGTALASRALATITAILDDLEYRNPVHRP